MISHMRSGLRLPNRPRDQLQSFPKYHLTLVELVSITTYMCIIIESVFIVAIFNQLLTRTLLFYWLLFNLHDKSLLLFSLYVYGYYWLKGVPIF